MCETKRSIRLGAGEDLFGEGTHACLVYGDEEQREATIGRFLALGLAAGEQIGYTADETPPDEVRRWLADVDPLAVQAAGDGAFELLDACDVYAPNGVFEPGAMLETLERRYRDAMAHGYTGARVSGEMTWALRGLPGSERLIEYEARINLIVDADPITVVCQYDARRFDGATILDVLRVHPTMIVRGQVLRNPYYVRPEEFLAAHGGAR